MKQSAFILLTARHCYGEVKVMIALMQFLHSYLVLNPDVTYLFLLLSF